jgi:hypothetical protein
MKEYRYYSPLFGLLLLDRLEVSVPARNTVQAKSLSQIRIEYLPVSKQNRVSDDLVPADSLTAALAFRHRDPDAEIWWPGAAYVKADQNGMSSSVICGSRPLFEEPTPAAFRS